MTFAEYIQAIHASGLYGKNKITIIQDLFKYAGASDIKTDTAKSWLRADRNCDIQRYFPDLVINEIKFITFFENIAEGLYWKKLQVAFNNPKISSYGRIEFCVDLNTDDPQTFYLSLLSQFRIIFKLRKATEAEKNMNKSELISSSDEILKSFFLYLYSR